MDAHLILNGLSRIAAQYYAVTKRESEEVYALSDYLTRGLRANASKELPASREAQLLEAYLELLRACKFGQLEASVVVDADAQSVLWPAHCTGTIGRQLLQTLRLESDEPLRLHVRFDGDSVEWTFSGSRACAASATLTGLIKREVEALELVDVASVACQMQPAGVAVPSAGAAVPQMVLCMKSLAGG